MNTNFEVIGLTRSKESNPSPEVDVSRDRRIRCEEMCVGDLGVWESVERVWRTVLGCGGK